MRCWLIPNHDKFKPFELPGLSELDAAGTRGPRPPVTVGSSSDCDLRLPLPGVKHRHLRLTWDEARATWAVENLGETGDLLVNNQPVPPRSPLALPFERVDLTLGAISVRFERHPAPPEHAGQVMTEIVLGDRPVIIGRKPPGGEATPEAERVDLDPEIRYFSSRQAAINRAGRGHELENLRLEGKFGTALNGKQGFPPTPLVFGDRIQMPGFNHYTFVYCGGILRHLGARGWIQARGVTVDVPGRRILNNVDLDIAPGEFVGILGGSGQGKSTLMNALCGLNPPTGGAVMLDGLAMSSRPDAAETGIGFVPQDDIVHADLTVEQAIRFSARLKLNLPDHEITPLVERTIERLQLDPHRHKTIHVLSGGQRKRVSIACELLTLPNILFLDEPTSGLDPAIEGEFMDLLRRLANSGLTVVCTTHVLQNAHVFDKLVFIHGGEMVFAGDPYAAASYFFESDARDISSTATSSAASDTSGAMATQNPDASDTSVMARPRRQRLLSQLPRVYTLLARSEKPAAELASDFAISPHARPVSPVVEPPPPASAYPKSRKVYRVGYGRSLRVLLSRQWKIMSSRLLNLVFLAAQALVIGLLIGWVTDDLVLRMFLCVVATMWFGCSNGAQQIVGELAIFRRERVSGLGLNVYLHSKLIFLFLLTGLQAMMLFGTSVLTADLVHGRDDPPGDFATAWNAVPLAMSQEAVLPGESTAAAGNTAAPEPEEAINVDEFDIVVADKSKPASSAPPPTESKGVDPTTAPSPTPAPASRATPAKVVLSPPAGTGFGPTVLAFTARTLDVRKNLIDWGDKWKSSEIARAKSAGQTSTGSAPWLREVLKLWGLRLAGLIAAAMIGVALGLMISSLVATPTQAVMWVPLILIPQILFGGFVVTKPEMSTSVRLFSSVVPSFCAQRIMDVSVLYRQDTPRMSNESKIPVFLAPTGANEETVRWKDSTGAEQEEKYDKISDRNKSWQNILVLPRKVGQRFKEADEDEVDSRSDVLYARGASFRNLLPAAQSASVLGGWLIVCYALTLLGLRKNQTGK